MDNKTIILDSSRFYNLSSFYDEVEKVLTKDLNWHIGRNLNAFNDVLRGGFGMHEYDEPIRVIWLNCNKSREDLGWKETVEYVKAKLETCHPSNIELVRKDLALADRHEGKTLFEIIVDIIQEHGHIELRLE